MLTPTDIKILIGWAARIIMWGVGAILMDNGFTADETQSAIHGTASVLVGLSIFGTSTLWSFLRKKKGTDAQLSFNVASSPSSSANTLRVLPLLLGLSVFMSGCALFHPGSLSDGQRYKLASDDYAETLQRLAFFGEIGVIKKESTEADAAREFKRIAGAALDDMENRLLAGQPIGPAHSDFQRVLDEITLIIIRLEHEMKGTNDGSSRNRSRDLRGIELTQSPCRPPEGSHRLWSDTDCRGDRGHPRAA